MIEFYTLYEKQSGKILTSFYGNKSTICPQETDLIGVLNGNYSLEMYVDKYLNVVPIPQKQFQYQIFDYKTKTLISDVTLLLEFRNSLLLQSDWTQIPNNPLTLELQQQWATYRQALRDITAQPGYPNNVIWPTPPQG